MCSGNNFLSVRFDPADTSLEAQAERGFHALRRRMRLVIEASRGDILQTIKQVLAEIHLLRGGPFSAKTLRARLEDIGPARAIYVLDLLHGALNEFEVPLPRRPEFIPSGELDEPYPR